MASRTHYGGQALPMGIVFDRCPDCITLTFTGGLGLEAGTLVYEVPVTGVVGNNNPDFNVPGRVYEVRDPVSGDLIGTIVFIKDLDGRVRIRVTAQPGHVLTVTTVQYKNNGGPLGPPVVLDAPVTHDGDSTTGPTTSPPFTPPPVGALRVNKCRDDQTVTQGSMITWRIKVTNVGGVALTNVMVVDTFSACNFVIANLAVGAMQVQECTVPANAVGSFTNQAQAQGTGPNEEIARGRDTARFKVEAP